MLEQKIISFLKEKNWWYQDESIDYRNALSKLGVDMNSDFIQFYLHAEDEPTFYSRGKEIYQLGWFLINTSLLQNLYSINKSLGLSEDYIPLDNFEGENGFFYNNKTGEVVHLKLSEHDQVIEKWSSFSKFIEWYFNI
ncbi:hypothetical protein HYE59_00835 [Aggregatibacter actinomycetemcomitans]|uniref:hypothetical protein n=1 Tax=Aggregatibacter actinomycetemcomitans TaxID=714 RepID=UPI00197CA248|nr:hypothetical protein [Aggregatibacter actinomycetemcomitans]MBN6076121.1 hypothetical protein [Aggregatibacter actinomycetemcomitans]